MAYPVDETHVVPARSGVAVPLQAGQHIKVINTHGSQVIDFWALARPEPRQPTEEVQNSNDNSTSTSSSSSTYLSMSHTRASTLHLSPLVGDTLVTNHRTPILTLVEDSSPGVHDTLIAACDIHRYHQLGVPEDVYHANCVDNFRAAVAGTSTSTSPWSWSSMQSPPDPLNLFMNIPVDARAHSSSSRSRATEAGGAEIESHHPDSGVDDNNLTAGGSIRFEKPVCKKGDFVVFKALSHCLVVMSACPQDLVKVNDMMPTEAHFVVT